METHMLVSVSCWSSVLEVRYWYRVEEKNNDDETTPLYTRYSHPFDAFIKVIIFDYFVNVASCGTEAS